MQVKVTGGGDGVPGPLVKFPGAYKNTDAYAKFSIYSGHKAFPFPGPAVWSGSGNSSPQSTTKAPAAATTSNPSPVATTTKSQPVSTAVAGNPSTGVGAPIYGQCGGNGWTGPKTCSQGKCVATNVWYSQCLP